MRLVILALLIIISTHCLSQGTVLFFCTSSCDLVLDGDTIHGVKSNQAIKKDITYGKHIVQVVAEGQVIKTEMFDVLDENQVLLELDTDSAKGEKYHGGAEYASDPILLVDMDLEVSSNSQHKGENVSESKKDSEVYFNLAEGDILDLDATMSNTMGSFEVRVLEYPSWNTITKKKGLTKLDNHQLTIPRDGIYIIRIESPSLFNRTVHLKVTRTPRSNETVDFNTSVVKRLQYEAISIVEPTKLYLNSTSHETWKGGSNESYLPLQIPDDVIEWFYLVTATRSEEAINSTMKSLNLFGQVASLVSKASPDPAALVIGQGLKLGADALIAPPGSDVCDVYLLDQENLHLFESDVSHRWFPSGSIKQATEAKISMECCQGMTLFIGFENNDTYHGLHVATEVVGIRTKVVLEVQ